MYVVTTIPITSDSRRHQTELIDEYDNEAKNNVVEDSSSLHEDDIGFGKAHFTWTSEELNGTETPSRSTFRLRIDDELVFKRGAFNLIVGPTGSGKTSVLMALLREMHYVPLGLDSWVNLPKTGGVAYAAQESWVLNDTIKGNILFGAPFDEERYSQGMVFGGFWELTVTPWVSQSFTSAVSRAILLCSMLAIRLRLVRRESP